MENCHQCGVETKMYSAGVPLCPACDKAREIELERKRKPESPQKPNDE